MSAENVTVTDDEVKGWLLEVLKKENIQDLSVDIAGKTEKGDNYGGDVIFVHASGISHDNQIKTFDFVVKCSKRGELVRKHTPIKQTFLNEIHVYETVLPYFTKFQEEKGVGEVFKSFSKCYGSILHDDYEVIVLEDLRKKGFDLWSKVDPLTRKHISLVLGEYAKHHATSLALQKQRPEEYKRLASKLVDISSSSNLPRVQATFEAIFEEIAQLVKDDIDEASLQRWRKFPEQIKEILDFENIKGARVILHGDSWNNNFLFKNQDCNKYLPEEVAIIDWQISKPSSLILDLSYFLFTCISKQDINDIDAILEEYHVKLSKYLKQLGNDAKVIYPLEQLFSEWKINCRYGILLSSLIIKMCSTAKEEVVDVREATESGQNYGDILTNKIKNEGNLKKRMIPIIKYITEKNLI